MFCLTLAPSDDLINPLFRNPKGLSDAGPGFTRFVACDDFAITLDFFRHQIILRFAWIRGVVEHLNDMKSSQPDVEASCGFEARTVQKLIHGEIQHYAASR